MQRSYSGVLIGALMFIAGVVVTLVVQHLGSSQDDKLPTIVVYDDWRLGCPAADKANVPCELDQDVLDARTRTQLVHLTVGQTKTGRVLAITVPHNVLLPPGMALKIGDSPAKLLNYDICNSAGCIAATPVDAALDKALRTADKGEVTVASLQGKPAAIPFSLRGAKDGLSALDKSAARASSWWRRLFS